MGARGVHRGRTPGFSLVELVIVVVILGIVGAIAVPRMSRGAEGARNNRLLDDTRTLQEAIERYKAEHGGRTPAHAADGSIDTNGLNFTHRLTRETNEDGGITGVRLFGPYLRAFPDNAASKLDTVRINGAVPGAGTHGWHFSTVTGIIVPDDAERTILQVVQSPDSLIVKSLTP